MSCNVENNLCTFSFSDSHRASTFEFILDQGVSIPITESKCIEIDGDWKSNRCFINELLSKQMGNIDYTRQSTYTANGRTEISVVNSFSGERILVGDPCPSCGGEFRSISVAWNMPIVDEQTPTPDPECTSDSECLSTEECINELCIEKEPVDIIKKLIPFAIGIIGIFIIVVIVIILRKKL